VDPLVRVESTGEYEHSPIVTADDTLALSKNRGRIARRRCP
jgi:hypothetical protein